ncbi:hypothetical protein ACRAWD_00705 [Caulobacter segnis]
MRRTPRTWACRTVTTWSISRARPAAAGRGGAPPGRRPQPDLGTTALGRALMLDAPAETSDRLLPRRGAAGGESGRRRVAFRRGGRISIRCVAPRRSATPAARSSRRSACRASRSTCPRIGWRRPNARSSTPPTRSAAASAGAGRPR